MLKVFENPIIRTFVGVFTCREYDHDVSYVIQIKSPYGHSTPEDAANEDVSYSFRKIGGHIVIVAAGGDADNLRYGKSEVIRWKDWTQYHMAKMNDETGDEEPCSTDWDDLFGVDNVSDDFEVPIVYDSYNVFSYENI